MKGEKFPKILSAGSTRREFLKTAAGAGLLALAPSFLTGCKDDSRSAYSDTVSSVSDSIRSKMAQNNVPGLSIALVDGQNVVWAEGFGEADTATHLAATADTLYEIGSVSKVFTACLVMQLYDQGKLSLDDPLVKYIPSFSLGPALGSFPSMSSTVTIRSMLTHHSGIPGDLWNGAFSTAYYPDYNTRLLTMLQDDNAHYPPDFFLMYSNTAVSLLSSVIEAASGESFENRSDAFFRSLGMTHTSFFRHSRALQGSLAKGYFQSRNFGPFYNNAPAAGSMISSVRDMAKFIQMVHARGLGQNGRVLRAETVDMMLTRQNGSIPLDLDFPLGIMWKLYEPELAYAGGYCEHSGDTLLFESVVKILTDHNLGVVVLTNAAEGNPMHHEVAREALKSALLEKKGIQDPATAYVVAPSEIDSDSWSAGQLAALGGIYSILDDPWSAGTSPGRSYSRIEAVAGGLLWTNKNQTDNRAWDSDPFTIVPRKNGWFSLPASQEKQYEFRQMQGRIVMILHEQGRSYFMAEQYVPASIPAAWSARLGNYSVANLDPNDWSVIFAPYGVNMISYSVRLEIDNDVLVFRRLDGVYQAPLVVAPVSDTAGYMPSGGRNLAGSVKVVNVNGEEHLQFLGLLYKKT